jgi:hypothetical protein
MVEPIIQPTMIFGKFMNYLCSFQISIINARLYELTLARVFCIAHITSHTLKNWQLINNFISLDTYKDFMQ